MTDHDPDRDLLDLAGSLADGAPIDWEAELALAGDDVELLKNLGRVAAIARVMREIQGTSKVGDEPPVPGCWGHLQLQEELGRGSFGSVYLAHDPVLQREVAVKLRRNDAGEKGTVQWIAEARRLARVRHPHVLAVHGAGVHGGIAGLWSDRVDGCTLAEAVNDHGPMPIARIIDLALQLARAVAAVHEARIVHGDIKPSNIMLESDDRGRDRLVLMDFGAGTNPDRDEAPAGFGSPLVMAPELFSGKSASFASDVYAFGVVVYFMLCGRYPLDAESLPKLESLHQRATWPDPRRQRAGVPSRLARLVRRLGTNLPDRRPGWTQIISELEAIRSAPTRRKRRATVAAVIVLLSIGLAIALAGTYRARQAESETEAVNRFLTEVLSTPRPIESGPQTRVVEVLDRAAERLTSDMTDQPRARARILAIVGRTYVTLGRYEEAEPLLREALALRTKQLGPEHPDTIALMEWIGNVERETGRMAQAEATFRDMQALADGLEKPEHILAVHARIGLGSVSQRLGRFDEAEEALLEALALRRGPEWADDSAGNVARMTYGELLRQTGRFDEAEPHLRAVLDWSQQHNGERHATTLLARHQLVACLLDHGRLKEAEPLARRNVEVAREWLGEMDRYVAVALSAHSNLLYELGYHQQAMELNGQALEILTALSGPTHINTLSGRANRANRFMDIGDMANAEAEYREVDGLATGELGDAHPLVLMNRYNLAELFYRTDRNSQALELASAAHDRMRDTLGEEHLFTLVAGGLIGASLSRLGRLTEAEAQFESVIERQLRVMGASHPYTLETQFYRAENLARTGRAAEAHELARQVRDARVQVLGADHPKTRAVAEWLAAAQAADS
jgi:eukaryotic-like serine/threonine-protein kinase